MQDTRPGRRARAHRPGRVKLKSAGARAPRTTAYFFFGGLVEEEPLPEAGGGVVLLPELVLELVEPEPVPELAGGVVVLGAGAVEAGGAAAGAAVWFDGCLAQAVKSTAAASALRATFVFIDSTPVK
jgi:hypothetical protein